MDGGGNHAVDRYRNTHTVLKNVRQARMEEMNAREEEVSHEGRRRKSSLIQVVILFASLAVGCRGALWNRDRLLWDDYLKTMLRHEFTRMFRMDHDTFMYLVDKLEPHIDKNFHQSDRAGGYISPVLRVGMTVRWLAGGSYLDIKSQYGIGKSTFYHIVDEVVDAIVVTFPIQFDVSLPAMKQRAKEFGLRQWKHMRVFNGVIGAIDGLLVKIKCPSVKEVGMPRTFFTRKGFFALNVQAVCDVRKRFIFVSMDMPGSSHDARAFFFSNLWQAIQEGCIAQGFYLIGDAAYRTLGTNTPKRVFFHSITVACVCVLNAALAFL